MGFFDDIDDDLREFLQNDIYCFLCGKKLEPDEEIRIDNPFDIKRHKIYHISCYKKK